MNTETLDTTMSRIKRIRSIWNNMKYRCYGKHNSLRTEKCYQDKGISVCDEWRNDFSAFYDWAVSHGYDDDLTIDRIEAEGDYCPSNCQWITRKENSAKATHKKIAVDFTPIKTKVYVHLNATRDRCVAKGITFASLERACGLGNGTIGKWRKSRPRYDNIKKVADYLGCTIDELVAEDEEKAV